MKTKFTTLKTTCLFVVTGLFSTSQSQEICMVSTDYITGDNYIVFWEASTVAADADSIIIYRKTASDIDFVRAGSVKTGAQTYFVDENVDTKFATKYSIAFKDDAGTISAFSLWHQPFVLDYAGNGNFSNIPYLRQDQQIPISYNVLVDESGLGFFTQAGELSTTDVTDWFDEIYTDRPDAYYMVEVVHQTCSIDTKADINTSRSNIKQQISTAALGLNELEGDNFHFEIFPNPVQDGELNIQLHNEIVDGEYWITDAHGRILVKESIMSPLTTIDVSGLSNGFYNISINSNGKVSSKSWVK